MYIVRGIVLNGLKDAKNVHDLKKRPRRTTFFFKISKLYPPLPRSPEGLNWEGGGATERFKVIKDQANSKKYNDKKMYDVKDHKK